MASLLGVSGLFFSVSALIDATSYSSNDVLSTVVALVTAAAGLVTAVTSLILGIMRRRDPPDDRTAELVLGRLEEWEREHYPEPEKRRRG